MTVNRADKERVLLVKAAEPQQYSAIESDIEEMKGLISAANGTVIDTVIVKRPVISPAFYIGGGKAEEIALNYKDTVDLIVFDGQLKPVQVRNLEKITEKRVIDRTQLILDIFAARAQTSEGKLQVEFAQLNYLLPRLTGHGVSMSRLGGGIGTKGPGETKLETDIRKIRGRIQKIKESLESVKDSRERQRERRRSVPVPQIALVGYTNAGKTMFLNSMTNAGKLSEDKLFATLDPKVKQFRLPAGYRVLFSDTVGFIKNLPTQLVSAFRATLEEVRDADIILHIIDAGDADAVKHKETVNSILREIGAFEGKKIIEVWNKCDLLDGERRKFITSRSSDIYISAKTGEGIERLLAEIEKLVSEDYISAEIDIPHKAAGLAAIFYDEAVVLSRVNTDETLKLKVKCTKRTMERYKKSIQEA
ncbi:MAG: GTPase HflX [Candidatus Goldiibacteriota bacterium HGW-Goldbacteria-1]|jgi:GTP-binding protein HflX|nr:MAG: GTPase HflX [Candidatus Goldiibacteriota bacterium HGW-Goldbacteria-1]